MEEIISILMNRDGVSRDEALAVVNECKRRLYDEAVPMGDYTAAEDIMCEELGLEMDYIFALLL